MDKKATAAILATLILSLMAWGGTNIISDKEAIATNTKDIATIDATYKNDRVYMIKSLDKLNTKMDKILDK